MPNETDSSNDGTRSFADQINPSLQYLRQKYGADLSIECAANILFGCLSLPLPANGIVSPAA